MSASLEALPKPLASFLRELPSVGCADLVAPMADALAALDDEGNDVEDAAIVVDVLARIAGKPWPVLERLSAMCDVTSARGKVTVTVSRNGVHIASRPS
jgi:hypothetical protein